MNLYPKNSAAYTKASCRGWAGGVGEKARGEHQPLPVAHAEDPRQPPCAAGTGKGTQTRLRTATATSKPTSSGDEAESAVPIGLSFASHRVSSRTVWFTHSCTMNI
jgi:hypothetical protein